jgi:DNA-binding beta-propeller fold protein YncE
VAIDAHGNVFVADTGNNRIVKLSPEGVLLTTWGEKGAAAGQFDQPRWVTVDARGNVYVADFGNNRIQHLPVEASS